MLHLLLESRYQFEYVKFDKVITQIKRKAKKANEKFATQSTGGALAAAGVAAFAPTMAMAFATTFGVASTGTAISALSGAAATNAALAWLGGGALAAGGGGMTAGNALLAMAGPIGWTIGGLALVGSGIMMNRKCLDNANEAINARKKINKNVSKLTISLTKITNYIKLTKMHLSGIWSLLKTLQTKAPNSYRKFTREQKEQIGTLVNHITALSGLLKKKVR